MKSAVVFPGYGSQFVGMIKGLYDEHRVIQEYFEEAANCIGGNFVKLCFASSEAELASVSNTYLSLFLVCTSVFDLIATETTFEPDIIAGFNQGEYAALCAAGGIGFTDGLYLVHKYATLYQEALEQIDAQVLTVTGLETSVVEDMCSRATEHSERAYVAIYYRPDMHVLSGNTRAMQRVRDYIDEAKGTITETDLGVGLHSPQMDMVYHGFKPYIEKVDCRDLTIPMMSEVLGQGQISGCQEVKDSIAQHINTPVQWTRMVERLEKYDTIIEVGPGTTLSDMLRERYPNKQIITVGDSAGLREMKRLYPANG